MIGTRKPVAVKSRSTTLDDLGVKFRNLGVAVGLNLSPIAINHHAYLFVETTIWRNGFLISYESHTRC